MCPQVWWLPAPYGIGGPLGAPVAVQGVATAGTANNMKVSNYITTYNGQAYISKCSSNAAAGVASFNMAGFSNTTVSPTSGVGGIG